MFTVSTKLALMNMLKLTVNYAGDPAPRAFLIHENNNGSLTIDEVGHPRIEGGRSICIHFDRGDNILAVERFETTRKPG